MPSNETLFEWLTNSIAQYKADQCLIWPFAKGRGGYGKISINGGTVQVHRVAFYITPATRRLASIHDTCLRVPPGITLPIA